MGKPVDQLFSMKACEMQSSPVVTIPQTMSMREAGLLLSRTGISGAPVVDDEGRCVGVLSATDFLPAPECGAADPAADVRCCLTADPVMVGPAVRLRDLARMMIDAHIHRIIVVDADRRPTGMVTSTDILAVLAFAQQGAAAVRDSAERSGDCTASTCGCNR